MPMYYEVGRMATKGIYTDLEVVAFDTLDEAIEYADNYGCNIISQIGGNWSDFERCTFCGEWWESTELNKDGECMYCEQAIKSHGGF